MKTKPSWISTPAVSRLLDSLYADAAENDPLVFNAARDAGVSRSNELDFYTAVNKAYMPVGREFGKLLYTLARSTKAQTVVEFGTSFGISTIFLASALRDNGSGKVITTEYDAGKAERARKNLTEAGLAEWVEFRVGDARAILNPPPTAIDMVLLDGPKGMYLDVLKILEPAIRSGAVIASDNTDHEGMEAFLEYIRNTDNGYTTSAILTEKDRGHEVTIRN